MRPVPSLFLSLSAAIRASPNPIASLLSPHKATKGHNAKAPKPIPTARAKPRNLRAVSISMGSSNVAGDDADPTRTPSTSGRGVNLGPVLEDTPPRLRFTVGPCSQKFALADAPGFISSINDALVRHADAQVDSLEISLVFGAPFQLYLPSIGGYAREHPHAELIEAEHVRGWLRYGMARAAKSFILVVPPCPPPPTTTIRRQGSGREAAASEAENEGMALELPAWAIAATMALTLGNATLTLPAPADASFHALTELLLSHARIDDWDRLSKLLSSPSFPCLKRLRLEYLVGVVELELGVDELEELTIVGARDLRCLVVNALCLRTLCVTDCSSLESDKGELAISAPALEVLICSNMCMFQGLQFDAPSVREIGKLPLWTHGHRHQVGRNEASIWIMKHCTAAHRLNLHLHVPQFMRDYLVSAVAIHSGMVDYESILVEEIPELPNITALSVNISTWRGHSYAASLARLIAQCVNLEELHIDVKRDSAKPACSDQACVCNNKGGWENQKFSLERLRYLNITGVQGPDYEERLAQMILAGAPGVDKFKLPR